MADYNGRRRVFQAYRRLGEGASAENPYPTIVSATRAIEERAAENSRNAYPQFETPNAMPARLEPAKVFDTRILTDNIMRADKPRIPPKRADETSYPVYSWGLGGMVRPDRTEIIPDPMDPNREIIRSHMKGSQYDGAFAIAHAHPEGADPYPGPEDWKVPVQQGRPSYVATDKNIFRINPPDENGWMSVDLIDGEWGRPDAEVEAAVNRMNRRETVGVPSKRGRR